MPTVNNQIKYQIELKNYNIIIRNVFVEDAKSMIEYVNIISSESDNLTYGSGEFNFTVEQEQKYIESMNNNALNLFILATINDEIVSIAQIQSNKKIRLSHLGQIALSVKQKHWRKGIGNQMMKTLIQWAKNNNFKKLNLEVTTTNEGAISLYKKHDFIIEGTNKRSMMIKGNYIDTYQWDESLADFDPRVFQAFVWTEA